MPKKAGQFSYSIGIRDKREWKIVKTYQDKVFIGTEDDAYKKLDEVNKETGQVHEVFILLEVPHLELVFGKKKR